MTRTALIVGGTGPTGPAIVQGLTQRGYQVVLLHRGTHEVPELADLEHIHADPHFPETLADGLGERRFDLVVATYGRLRHVAGAVAGRCGQFIGVSGVPVYPGYFEPSTRWPQGMPIAAREPAADAHPPTADDGSASGAAKFSRTILAAEQAVLGLHADGAFSATLLRYPSIYGPRQLYPRDWSVVKRVLDGRESMILPDNGLSLITRCAAANAAQFVTAAVDRPEPAAGEVFNVADLQQYSLRQWVELTCSFAGRQLELVPIPFELAGPGRALFPIPHTEHGLVSTSKVERLLDYTEAVSATEALASTVEWLMAHPPDEATVERMTDTFDYAEEDRVIAAYRAATAELLAGQSELVAAAHPYAHPKEIGATDHRGR